MWAWEGALEAALKGGSLVWDLLTYPIFLLAYRPWRFYDRNSKVRASIVDKTSDSLTVRCKSYTCETREKILKAEPRINTLDQLFGYAFRAQGEKPCLGTRPILKEEKVLAKDGRLLTQYELGPYQWLTFREVESRSRDFALGLRHLGFHPGDKVAIYAETKAKWLISAIGCLRNSFPLITVYANLGEDGVAYVLNQTDAKLAITSEDLWPKLKGIIRKGSNIHTVVRLEKETVFSKNRNLTDDEEGASSVNVYDFNEVLKMGSSYSSKNDEEYSWTPKPEDIAVIMYTSGSTGNPKGALLTHSNLFSNIISSCAIACNLLGDQNFSSRYIAYLPLAHIFELTMEIMILIKGGKIGYSGPNTLTEAGTMIKEGQIGDARALKPNIIVAVPLILDRIFKGIRAKVSAGGPLKRIIFEFCYQYRSKWIKRGFDTPLLNRLIFKTVRESLGGEIMSIIGGGAPLSVEVHDFLETVLCVKISQGYGLTESSGGICLGHIDDYNLGEVGYPLPDVQMKLVNWEEGEYTVNDLPLPRGEIHIGGSMIAKGYYNLIENTQESFYEKNGVRWFPTGDVAELQPTGAFKIVDRKKDLVKLQLGEYVSLAKVESVLKLHPVVDSVCSYGDSFKNDVIALVVPDQKQLLSLVVKDLKFDPQTQDFVALCNNPEVIQYVLKLLKEISTKKLEKFEIPKKIALIPEAWTPESGLVTAAMKLRRRPIKEKYNEDINRMYQELEEERNPNLLKDTSLLIKKMK